MLKSNILGFTFKRQITVFVRCLADKPSDSKPPGDKIQSKEEKTSDSNLDKIQELLKNMMTEPKISESEYRQKFVTAPERRRKQKLNELEITAKIEESITRSAAEVAQAIGGDVKQTEAELLSKVLGKINQTSTTLSDLLVGMKVDRSKESDDSARQETRGQQVKRLVDRPRLTDTQQTTYVQKKTQPQRKPQSVSSSQPITVNVFDGKPLGIFTAREANFGTKLDVWNNLKQRELTLATAQPPANYFEKMILWTNQGKVWKFPIDNEQGLEEEQNVHFSEHVFMENHLEGWCPTKGPIRHFMELVCVGLSKNAFYTAQEKKDHIMWYKEYFESKKDVLIEVGVWNVNKSEKNEVSM